MNRALLTVTLLASLALAGCADDGGSQDQDMTPTAAECEAEGLVLGTNSTTGDPGCVVPAPPATITIQGLPATLQAYATATFTWVLETPKEENHAMRTEMRVATESTPVDERTQADDWGESVAKKEHQNFVSGQSYDATFSIGTPGTYYFRAFALVEQHNLWSDEYVLEVTAPVPTGVTRTVNVTAAGFPGAGSIDPADLTISLGDAVSWVTTDPDPDTYTISSDSGPESFSTTTDGEAVTFLVPGTYGYSVTGSLGDVVGDGSGTIRVQA